MSALREIFASFTTKFDDKELKKGDRTVKGLTDTLSKFGPIIAGSTIVGGLRLAADRIAELGDRIDKTSRQIGLSTQALQEWEFAAQSSGSTAEDFRSSAFALQAKILEASEGSSTAVNAFRRLGVEFKDSEGQLRSVEDVLTDMADPLTALGNDTERVAVLNALMGETGARLGPLFDKGAGGIEAMRQQVQELGGAMSGEAIEASADYADSNLKLRTAFTSLSSTVGIVLLPVVSRLVESLAKGVAAVSRATEGTKFWRASLIVLIGILGGLGALVLSTFGPIIATLGLAALGALVFVAAIDDILVTLDGGRSLISEYAEAVEALFELHNDNLLVRFWEGVTRALEETIGAFASLFGGENVAFGATTVRGVGATQADVGRRVGPGSVDLASLRAQQLDSLARANNRSEPINRVRLPQQGGLGQATLVNNNNINLTATGANAEEVARVARREIAREMDRQSEEAVEALGQLG